MCTYKCTCTQCPSHYLSFFLISRPRKKARVLKKASTRSHNFPPLIPLRRSKREKRLVYANFTPREIDNTILNKSACLIDESSEVSTIFLYFIIYIHVLNCI